MAACSVVFSLLCDLHRPVGVPRLIKYAHFLIFLAVWVLFLSFWAGVKEWLILELHEMIKVSHILASPIVLFSFVILVGMEE